MSEAKRFVYADNAATTAVSPSVLRAMEPYYTTHYGNPSSLYSIGQAAKRSLEAARRDVAECLNADPNEIFFTSGGSEADNWAIKGAAHLLAQKGKKHIITTKFEHHAVLHACAEDPAKRSVVNRAIDEVDDRLQIIIAFLKFIPERNIVLRKLKRIQLARLCHFLAQEVGSGKNPAASAAFLIGDRQSGDFNRKMEPITAQAAIVKRYIGDFRFGHSVCHRAAGRNFIILGREF